MNESATGKRRGDTVPQQGETTALRGVPKLPHERDESSDSQADGQASDNGIARKAQADAQSPRSDTGRKPVIQKTYDKVAGSDAARLPGAEP